MYKSGSCRCSHSPGAASAAWIDTCIDVEHVVEAPGNGHGPFEDHRAGTVPEGRVPHGRMSLGTRISGGAARHSTEAAIAPATTAASLGRWGPRNAREPEASHHRGPQQDENVGSRRYSQSAERQHPGIQGPIQPAVEAEREIECQRQTNGVQHPGPIERRPETDDQERERDECPETGGVRWFRSRRSNRRAGCCGSAQKSLGTAL